jgi:hypothetical protein
MPAMVAHQAESSVPKTPVLTSRAVSITDDESTFTSLKALAKLSPRTKEACRILGVPKNDLVARPFEMFAERGLAPEIQKLRYQEYEAMRQDTIHVVRLQREELMKNGFAFPQTEVKKSRARPSTAATDSSANGAGKLVRAASADKITSTQIQREQERMKRVMKRQSKELENMMSFEVKMNAMLQKQEAKMEWRRKREEQERLKRKAQAKEIAEKRKQWEIVKREREKEEKEKQQAEARKAWEQEQRFLKDQKIAAKKRKKEVKLRREELARKQAEIERRQKEVEEEKALELREKQAEMERYYEKKK